MSNKKNVEHIVKQAKEQNQLDPSDQEALQEAEELFQSNIYANKDFAKFLQHEEFRLKKQDAESERNLREKNANRAFTFSAIWACCILVLVFVNGFYPKFALTETEYITTIGTLSVTILAYYGVVVRHLFYKASNTDMG